MKEVLGDKNSVVISTEYLKGKGFNSKYFTHLDLDNNKYRAGINDIIIEKIGGSKEEIIKKLNKIENSFTLVLKSQQSYISWKEVELAIFVKELI